MRALLEWLDDRTGFRGLLRAALFERIPGGARWRYVWGSTLTFAIFVQFVTGLVLWAAYSANAQGAWESVYFIEHEMLGGWVLRGVHHYMAQATIILLVIHLMQVVIDGAYRAPREVNFWFGLGLLFVVLGLSLSGYLLPWDQKGFWATKVATSIAAITPVIGPTLQQMLVGGTEYGHHTLTRFFALHAGVLPGLLMLMIVAHVYLFRRHGVTVVKKPEARDGFFWPDQVLRDGVASLAVMVAVLVVVFATGGAELGAPADPTEPYAAARPEWYFMFLFQWLKYFPAGWEIVGAHLIPGFVVTLLVLMPIFARARLGHRLNLALLGSVIVGIVALTTLAYVEDGADPDFAAAVAKSDALSERMNALVVAAHGIPAGGGLSLLRSDPMTQGPALFSTHCSSCHRVDGHDGLGGLLTDDPAAADLAGFGSREWLTGLLDPERFATPEYFGGTQHVRGRMSRVVQRAIASFGPEQVAELGLVVKALSAEAALPRQAAADSVDRAEIEEGGRLMATERMNCTRCHLFHGVNQELEGPQLTGWGSREWMLGMLQNPGHVSFYGDSNDGMPAFGDDAILTEAQMGLIVDWLRQDWYEVEAGGR
jgi:ubiquinol-cytochrome c reductase cytochrome b subunit